MRNTLVRLILFAIVVMFPVAVVAQHNHDEGHHDYKDWASGRTWNCCDEKDCGDLDEDEVRETPQGTEVLVQSPDHEMKWCPVTKEHYLTKGHSPDWSKPHACIIRSGSYADECHRFLCFTPRGGF